MTHSDIWCGDHVLLKCLAEKVLASHIAQTDYSSPKLGEASNYYVKKNYSTGCP